MLKIYIDLYNLMALLCVMYRLKQYKPHLVQQLKISL